MSASSRSPVIPSGSIPVRDGRVPRKLGMFFTLVGLHDVVIVFGAGFAAWVFYAQAYDPLFTHEYGKYVLIACAIVPWLFHLFGCYEPRPRLSPALFFRKPLLATAALFAIMLVLGFLMKSLNPVSRGWAIIWVAGSVGGILATRWVGWLCVDRIVATGALSEKIAIVGGGAWGQKLAARLAEQREMAQIIGLFDDRDPARLPWVVVPRFPRSSIEQLLEYGKRNAIDRIIVAMPPSAEDRLASVFLRLKALAADIFIYPEIAGAGMLELPVTRFSGLPLFQVAGRPLSSWRYGVKMIQDKCLAILLLFLLLPLISLISVLIKLDSPGPVFFRQRRYGFNGREILVWKFRTMYADRADEHCVQQTRRGDPRVTRLGRFLRKTSLDELPQLFNVLAGQMSIVGPRPHAIGMRTDNRLSKEIVAEYAHRYRVKPGITGWAQINGYRGATDTADRLQKRVEYDLYYIENWSIALDLKIICLTGLRVFTMRDAY